MEDFIRGVLVSEEIEGNKLFMQVIKDDYASTMSNLPMYDSVSKDVIHRWSFPMVPDNLSVSACPYSLGRHNLYLAKDVTVGRDCSIEEDVVIGPGSHIGAHTRITQSVIGKNCKIGENVVLENAYLWDGVTVEANSRINMALLCNDVNVKSGVSIQEGCILSFKVKVGPNITLPRGTLLTKVQSSDDDWEGDEFQENDADSGTADTPRSLDRDAAAFDKGLIGEEGEGYVWRLETGQGDDDEDEELIQQMLGLNVSVDVEDDEESEESDHELEDEGLSPPASPPPDDTKLFYNEVLDSLQRTIEEKVKVDNLILEVNSSKYAYNVSMHELNQLVMRAILELPHVRASDPLSAPQLLKALKELFTTLRPLFHNYVKGNDSQRDCLIALEDYCLTDEVTTTILAKLIQLLYGMDVLSEDIILSWYYSKTSNEDQETGRRRQEVRSHVQPFITWLEEAEEESESDED